MNGGGKETCWVIPTFTLIGESSCNFSLRCNTLYQRMGEQGSNCFTAVTSKLNARKCKYHSLTGKDILFIYICKYLFHFLCIYLSGCLYSSHWLLVPQYIKDYLTQPNLRIHYTHQCFSYRLDGLKLHTSTRTHGHAHTHTHLHTIIRNNIITLHMLYSSVVHTQSTDYQGYGGHIGVATLYNSQVTYTKHLYTDQWQHCHRSKFVTCRV